MTADARSDLLHELLAWPAAALGRPMDTYSSWRTLWDSDLVSRRAPIERSIVGGFLSDRLAWAFASGYQGAIRQLIPDLPEGTVAAICITESGGNHPRAIRTRLTRTNGGYGINGEKLFVTGGAQADRLIVAASTGVTDGRNRIQMAVVDGGTPGLVLRALPPLSFVPEIRHCAASFEDVPIPADRLMQGDGYTGYIKPFRTIEDLHVTGSLIGFLCAAARRLNWPERILENLAMLIVTIRSLSLHRPLSPDTHIAIGGLFRQIEAVLAEVNPLWPDGDSPLAHMWRRDVGLLRVAGEARQRRLRSAWRSYAQLWEGRR